MGSAPLTRRHPEKGRVSGTADDLTIEVYPTLKGIGVGGSKTWGAGANRAILIIGALRICLIARQCGADQDGRAREEATFSTEYVQPGATGRDGRSGRPAGHGRITRRRVWFCLGEVLHYLLVGAGLEYGIECVNGLFFLPKQRSMGSRYISGTFGVYADDVAFRAAVRRQRGGWGWLV